MQDHKKNTLTPTWNERKWLMVQEPQTQDLRIEVFDWDRINAKELLTINLLKGLKDTMGSKTLMGRCVSQVLSNSHVTWRPHRFANHRPHQLALKGV